MEIRRYRATNVKQGVVSARAELGPDAVVLSTKRVSRSAWFPWLGGREVEITAAGRPDVSVARPQLPEFETGPAGDPAADPSITELVARLRAGNVDDDLAVELALGIPPTRRRGLSGDRLIKVLAERFQPLVATGIQAKPIEVFVGPPGMGKTTTIAKIAAQARARAGVSVGLIAADGYRVEAVEQLRIYADIIGTPFTVATTASDLELAIAVRRQPVLVDTAGRPPHDQAMCDLFSAFSSRDDIRIHLVLDAGQSARQISAAVTAYRMTRPDRIVVTKLDQIGSLGPMLRVLRDTRIPVSYLCAGQGVPEDLHHASPELFAASVLGEIPRRGEEID